MTLSVARTADRLLGSVHDLRAALVDRAQPSKRTLAQAKAMSWTEAAVVGVGCLAVSFAVYGPRIAHGGFVLDDWAFAADYRKSHSVHGFFTFIAHTFNGNNVLVGAGRRPIAALYFALTYTVFGTHMALHLAWIAVLAAAMSALLYAVLRGVGLMRLHAALIALLVLVFPAADAPRLWPAAAQGQLALSIFLVGVLLAFRGLREHGRSAIVWHVMAVSCYVISLLTYEIATAFVLLAFLLYWVRTSWRSALVRLPADWLALAAVVGYYRVEKVSHPASLSAQLSRARNIEGQARALLESIGIQNGPTRLPAALVLVVLAIALAVWLVSRDNALRRWLAVAAAGLLVIGAGYASFVPAESFYLPLRPGIGNRTNIAAAAGYVLFISALFLIAGRLAVMLLRRVAPHRSAPAVALIALPLLALAMLAAVWIQHVERDTTNWNRAFAVDKQVLGTLDRTVRAPKPNSTIYTFGVAGTTATLVPTFFAPWDLTGAIRLLWHDYTLHGVPVVGEDGSGTTPVTIACGKQGVAPRGALYQNAPSSPYGETVFVDVTRASSAVIRTQRECRAALQHWPKFRAGA